MSIFRLVDIRFPQDLLLQGCGSGGLIIGGVDLIASFL